MNDDAMKRARATLDRNLIPRTSALVMQALENLLNMPLRSPTETELVQSGVDQLSEVVKTLERLAKLQTPANGKGPEG